jgi:hypothetical protein
MKISTANIHILVNCTLVCSSAWDAPAGASPECFTVVSATFAELQPLSDEAWAIDLELRDAAGSITAWGGRIAVSPWGGRSPDQVDKLVTIMARDVDDTRDVIEVRPTSRFVFAYVCLLAHGDTPWGYRSAPGELEGPYAGESVESLLDQLAAEIGDQTLASSRVQWWVRGDALWVAPLEAD